MHGKYVTDILKICMKKFNAEKIIFEIHRVLICILRGYTVSLACSQFLVVPRLFEAKRRDIVFGIPYFRGSVVLYFRPPKVVGTLCAQLLLLCYVDSFETTLMFWSCFEDEHVV